MKNIFFSITLIVISILPAKSQDSTTNPITKRLGIACFPLDNEAGLAYCFGKKGRMKIEYDFTFPFSEAYSYPLGSNGLKFTFAWKSDGLKKVYSGMGIENGPLYDNKNGVYYSHIYVYDIYVYGIYSITPIGVELFPTSRLPGFSIILESNFKFNGLEGPHFYGFGRVGLCCYFPERKHNGKKRKFIGKITYQ